MKTLLLAILLLVPACAVNSTHYRVPAGYQTCRADYDCNMDADEYCGFVATDTYPVCRR